MERSTNRFEVVERKISSGRCVVLDGGTATELSRLSGNRSADERLWGADALVNSPDYVLSVHRRYAEAGCDVISTNTWGLPNALRDNPKLQEAMGPVHWMDVARRGIGLARQAASDAGRADECAVAFSLGGDIDTPEGQETIRLLARIFEEEPPDLVLVETLSLVRPSTTYETVERLLETGLPIWLSFRRCRRGLCGVFGEHWGGPEGDAFGRAVRQFEEMGVGALLINCIPPDHVNGMLPWLRDFTDLPLGVYPNLGYLSQSGWSSDVGVGGPEYAEMALRWREEGAQIVGGCCGVGPEHVEAAREAIAGTKPGDRRPEDPLALDGASPADARVSQPMPRWTDARGHRLFPLEFPDIVSEPGVFVPTQGSFLVWRHLFKEDVGAGRRCLDVGCGTGLLTVQLALNGAAHVHAIDLEKRAAANALANAFRNGVADRVTAESVDLYPWIPEERYDVIVASLYQMPVDPLEQGVSHRPRDYWGRNLLDHLIHKLPDALAPDGVAYLMQLSILGQQRTAELLDEQGFAARVVDFGFFEFTEPFREQREEILRVETFSDAYHLTFADEDVMVAYLLEVTHKPEDGT
ncbi:MAG: homocysteine S-methyltransferase family protein [Actinobacteria bacterium]|nr:homocysteine S-methyltransferase family protein [Actinomycetota bacterium]